MYCAISGERHCKCLNPLPKVNAARVDFRATFRKLWSDHANYTVFVIKSIIDGAGDSKFLIPRLMQNQTDIGDQLKEFIPDKQANELIKLLKEHISLAGEVVSLVKNKMNTTNKVEELYNNGDRIGKFLTSLNPIILKDARQMFEDHNTMVIEMAIARFKKDFAKEIKIYDDYYNQILMMSDMIYEAVL